VMIREIKQAARSILDWLFEDWMRLNGFEGEGLVYLFNDLDPSDAVDFKKLLIELYDRKLISRSSLQLKMDLDPDIENANRENEQKSINLLDDKQIKPVVDMVMAGIMSAAKAREVLGLPAEADASATVAGEKWTASMESQGEAHICDECSHFDVETNRCRVHNSERTFDAPACRFFTGRSL